MPHDLGAFRSVLATPPSARTFEDIIALINPFDDDVEMIAAYLKGHLARWPSTITRAVPDDFMYACDGARLCPLITLCNTLEVKHLSCLSDEALSNLVASPLLRAIVTLRMGAWHQQEALMALLSSPHLTGLRHLVSQCVDTTGDAILELFAHTTPHFQLHTLDLSCCDLSTLHDLTHARCLSQLTHLSMPYNRLDDAQIATLVSLPLPSLTHLDLRHNTRLSVESASALARTPFEHLVWLDLNLADIGHEGARILADSTNLPTVVRRYWRAQCTTT